MKITRFSDAQIMSILKQAEGGVPRPNSRRENIIYHIGRHYLHRRALGREKTMG